jgi:hypothetical protein
MKLTLFAGRPSSNLSPYSVLPWVLQDYTSRGLSLASPGVYRNLSRPIGALNAVRLERLQESHSIAADGGYLYGFMYSSPAIVIGYLIGLEPFASLHIALQSGKFDHADRLFSSIPAAWASVCSLQSN